MSTPQLHRLFLRWLDTLLRDDDWRNFIATKVRQHELPVIEAGEKPCPQRV